jgi:uncharacterized integral membrane protein
MWIIRWIVIALFVIVILGFALQNQEQTTYVKILKWQSHNLPLYIFLYISFITGLVFWVLISALHILKLKGENFQLQRDNQKIRNELNRLRNANIEEEDIPTTFDNTQDGLQPEPETKPEETA